MANKKAFTLKAGRESKCKQNVRMSKDCRTILKEVLVVRPSSSISTDLAFCEAFR